MTLASLPYRQIHLDFHTSAQCRDVAADFDPEAFAATLAEARVESINLFAKCHHGYSYYPTRVGTMHPNLERDLLGEQLRALRAAGIRAPIYVSCMWDDLAAERNPGWLVVRRDGTVAMRPPLSGESQSGGGWSWSTLDLTSGYADYLCDQVAELCERYEPDGFWFDICFTMANWSPWGQARMRDAGVDLADARAVGAFWNERYLAFHDRMSRLVRERAPDATIFYNHATDGGMRAKRGYQTHLEIESLPTATHMWGYLHYPVAARHARTQGLPFLGQTGRFHKSWADFGGIKTSDQLDYEIGTIVAAGGRACVGDQLHPRGVLDPAVYRLVGHAYRRLEALEPWLVDAGQVTDLAILSLPQLADRGSGVLTWEQPRDVAGAAQLFLESGIQFDIVDPDPELLRRYPVLLVPDAPELDAPVRAALDDYVAAGGRLVLSGAAGLDPATGRFVTAHVPVRWLGPAATVPSYLRMDPEQAAGTRLEVDYDYACYGQAQVVEALPGASARGTIRPALFERTWQHFTSHAQAPVADGPVSPLVVANDRVLYFAAPVFGAYRDHDYFAYRELVVTELDRFLGGRVLRSTAPGWVEASVLRQPPAGDRPGRWVTHLVAYQPRRTAQGVPHVDDARPIAGISLELRTGSVPVRAYLAPAMTELAMKRAPHDPGVVTLELPPIGVHEVVVVEEVGPAAAALAGSDGAKRTGQDAGGF